MYNLYEVSYNLININELQNLLHLEEKDDAPPVEMDKDEMEENLIEYKYKTRETMIEYANEKLTAGLRAESDIQLSALSSDSYISTNMGSV